MDQQNYTSMLAAIKSICQDIEDERIDPFTGEKLNRKLMQLRRFCIPFSSLGLFGRADEMKLEFFLEVMNDDACWEETDMTHGLVFNRKKAAKKLVAPHNSNGGRNPFSDFDRWQIACWCGLVVEIVDLFGHFMEKREIRDEDAVSVKQLVKSLSGPIDGVDPMLEWWSHVCGHCVRELRMEDEKNMFVAGLDRALAKRFKNLQAVEFFWSQIIADDELNAEEKEKILMKAAWKSMVKDELHDSDDVFQYLLDQMDVAQFPKFFKSGLNKPGELDVLLSLVRDCRFDLATAIFNCLSVRDVDESPLFSILSNVNHIDCCVKAAEHFFVDMILKKDPISDNNWLLKKFISKGESSKISSGIKLIIKAGFVGLLWKTLERANSKTILSFNSEGRFSAVKCVFQQMDDKKSVEKLMYYYCSECSTY